MAIPGLMPETTEVVTVDRPQPGLAVVRFARAERMNSFDPDVLRRVREAIEGLLADPDVRAVVLTGSGKAFSAGADVAAFEAGVADGTSVQWVLDATAQLHPLLSAMRRSDTVIVAAVNGVAAGGGLGLALAADWRVGGPRARFAAGYFRLGLSPDGGATWLLPRLIGEQRTRRFLFENEVLDAEEAHYLGLLDELVVDGAGPERDGSADGSGDGDDDALLQRALEVATAWGRWSVHSREATKRLLDAQPSRSFEEQLDLERGHISAAAGTADFAEGVAAFRGKRDPTFS